MQGDTIQVLTFPWRYLSVFIAITIVFTAIAIVCFRHRPIRLLGFVFLFGALGIGGVGLPAMLTDHITITSHGISTTRGFWWAPIKEEFAFSDVDTILATTTHDSSGHSHPVWDVHLRDGHVQQITTGDLWTMHEPQIIAQLHAHNIEVIGASTTNGHSKLFITQIAVPLVGCALIISWIAFQIYHHRKSASAPPPPPVTSQTKGTRTLFKFDVPEIAQLPPAEQEKLLSTCFNNPDVQAAFTHYWQRPVQWAVAPCAIFAIIAAVRDWNILWLIAICAPTTYVLLLLIRPRYKRQLIGAVRAHLLVELSKQPPSPNDNTSSPS